MVTKIHTNFPILFDQPDDENEEHRSGEVERTESEDRRTANTFGILPYILTYCRITNETITAAYGSSVIHLFYVVSYETERLMKEEEMRKRYMRRGYGGL